jgi:hypothetical protein
MKRLILYAISIIAISVTACKSKDNKVDSADSGQVHVGGSTAADSSKYPTTPVETGGQDTTADGMTNTNPSKDTSKKNP